MEEHKCKFVGWGDIRHFTEWVYNNGKNWNLAGVKPIGVYGIPRGGLIPAVIISNILNIPMLASPRAGCIVVDDIVDTGTTLRPYAVSHHGRNAFTVTMYQKTTAQYKADAAYCETDTEDWIVFPWELRREDLIGKNEVPSDIK